VAPPAPAAFCLANWIWQRKSVHESLHGSKVANMHYNIFDIFWSILESKLHLASELMLKSRFIQHILTNFVNFKDEGWTDKSQRQNSFFKKEHSFNVALGRCFVKHFRNDTFDRNKTNKICHAPLYFFTQCIYGKRCKTLNYLHCASQKPSLSAMYVNFGLSIITSKVRQIISVMKTETLVFP
jgi:hypothetical protein